MEGKINVQLKSRTIYLRPNRQTIRLLLWEEIRLTPAGQRREPEVSLLLNQIMTNGLPLNEGQLGEGNQTGPGVVMGVQLRAEQLTRSHCEHLSFEAGATASWVHRSTGTMWQGVNGLYQSGEPWTCWRTSNQV